MYRARHDREINADSHWSSIDDPCNLPKNKMKCNYKPFKLHEIGIFESEVELEYERVYEERPFKNEKNGIGIKKFMKMLKGFVRHQSVYHDGYIINAELFIVKDYVEIEHDQLMNMYIEGNDLL